ncbi:MAG: YiiX family permuted papain-like enzyme [Sphingobacteriales bacterium]|nr:MAG: YiiX family permuted papain-like enzyme [Sphingobacteriales bacterium]
MKLYNILSGVLMIFFLTGTAQPSQILNFGTDFPAGLKEGDIIFQTSLSRQSKAIQLATKSKYSHCGILYISKGRFFVLEAVQPVKLTPLADWIDRGKKGHYVVKRLKDYRTQLLPATIQKMRNIGTQFLGKDYDLAFDWSDRRMYCSELIWKVYERGAGIKIGNLERLRNFDLTHPTVRKLMAKRYGHNIPFNEQVISPGSMFNSDLLTTVLSN